MRCPHCGHAINVAQPLTKRQAELYRYVAGYQWARSYAPTFEEIADAFEYRSLATVHEHLGRLEKKGWIHRTYHQSRAIACLVALDEMASDDAAEAMEERIRQVGAMRDDPEYRP